MTDAAKAGFLGGIGLTHLTVYEQRPAPDGTMSGCAHIHGLTDEAYYVIAGTGALELHDLERGFRRVSLRKGSFVQFPPHTLHRSVSTGGLEVLALMSNAGLAERGDARIYFGREVDGDPASFAHLTGLPAAGGLDGALERRDASVRAYIKLLDLWDTDSAAYRAELQRFIALHRHTLADRRDDHEATIRGSTGRWFDGTLARLDGSGGLTAGSGTANQSDAPPRYGMCGVLRQFEGLSPA